MKRSSNIFLNKLEYWWGLFIYKPHSSEIYWEKILSTLTIVVVLVFLIYISRSDEKKLASERRKYERFTIGITTDYHNNIRSSYTDIDFKFFVGNKQYKGSGYVPWLHNNVQKIDGRYYVKFASNNPMNAEILFKNPVPDSVLEAPDSGWAYMPGYPK